MRSLPALLLLPSLLLGAGLPARARAQQVPLSPADSSLLYRVLTAEDHRDAADSALAAGMRSTDPRLRALATRARARIRDSAFADRSNSTLPVARFSWPLPEWWSRIGAVAGRKDDCGAMAVALADSAWQVRFRAADVVTVSCANDPAIHDMFLRWITTAPVDLRHHATGVPSWQSVAHAVHALARMGTSDARAQVRRLVRSPEWGIRLYVARAAALVSDTATLRTLTVDRDDNVKEAAIDGLSHLTGHADDAVYRKALNASGAQAVRAAANALKGSTDPASARALERALRRWLRRPNDSERDARLALLAAAGRPATEDRKWNPPHPLPPDVVLLALGADVRLRVTMDSGAGGGSFAVKLRGDVAPITAARVLAMARRGYYDGLRWQRVLPDFVVQGGGPGASEYVGYTHFFRDELGTVSHLRGGVGMSTRGHDTGDGQWFFDMGDNQRLDKDYTLFGEVVEGMPVVDGIMEGDRIVSIRPIS